jgi:hypothetical protein
MIRLERRTVGPYWRVNPTRTNKGPEGCEYPIFYGPFGTRRPQVRVVLWNKFRTRWFDAA